MGIQINVNRFFPEALVLAQATDIRFFPVAANAIINVAWEVYGDRQSRDEGDPPQYSFDTRFTVSDLNLSQAVSTLRSQFETALRSRCAADLNACGDNPRGRAVRNAIVAVGNGGTVAN
jgi:hypothetical protein